MAEFLIDIKGANVYFDIGTLSLSKTEKSKLELIVQTTIEVALKYTQKNIFKIPPNSIPSIELGITLCGDVKMKRINRNFRGKDKTTDVLSFPGFEDLRKNPTQIQKLHMINIGDIIVSKDKAQRQAKQLQVTYYQELVHLIIHGYLHLLGFDHEISRKEEMLMQMHEQNIIKNIYRRKLPGV